MLGRVLVTMVSRDSAIMPASLPSAISTMTTSSLPPSQQVTHENAAFTRSGLARMYVYHIPKYDI